MAKRRDAVCRGCWQLGNNCGSCPRCRIEAKAAFAERDALRALFEEYATFAADSGWPNLAEEIRRRVRGVAKAHGVRR